MRRMIVQAVLGASMVAAPAYGQSALRGQWHVALPSDPQYIGMVLIDGDGRAIWEPSDVPWRGYVSRNDGANAQITLANGTAVSQVRCRILSSDILDCNAHRPAGVSAPFMLKRVGEKVPKLWSGKP